jgi:hypothetical protein
MYLELWIPNKSFSEQRRQVLQFSQGDDLPRLKRKTHHPTWCAFSVSLLQWEKTLATVAVRVTLHKPTNNFWSNPLGLKYLLECIYVQDEWPYLFIICIYELIIYHAHWWCMRQCWAHTPYTIIAALFHCILIFRMK